MLRICELPALSQADIAAIQTRVSQRVLRWFVRRGWLEADEARAMRDWHNDGGFSLDAAFGYRYLNWSADGDEIEDITVKGPFAGVKFFF